MGKQEEKKVEETKKLPPPPEPKPDEIKNVVKDLGALKSLMFCYSDSEDSDQDEDGPTALSSKPPPQVEHTLEEEKKIEAVDEIRTDVNVESAPEEGIKASQGVESEKPPSPTRKQPPPSRNQQKQQQSGNKNNRNQRNNNRRNHNNSKDKQLLTTLNQPSLLRKLLEPEIRKERNDILQAIRYIVKNNFFDNFPPPTTK